MIIIYDRNPPQPTGLNYGGHYTRPHPALVIGKGNAVKDDYVLGDFIVIPRHQGVEMSWYGHTVRFLEGDKTYSVLQSPEEFHLSEFDPTRGEDHVSVQ